MLAFLAALTLELRQLRRQLDVLDSERLDGASVLLGELQGKPVLECAVGVGRKSEIAARALVRRFYPKAIISIGFAGALRGQYKAGTLVLCRRAIALPEGHLRGSPPQVSSDQRLLAVAIDAAQRQRLSHQVGTCLTVPYPIQSPQEKAALGQAYPADAVEMESFWLGSLAWEEDVPFLAARAIADEINDPIPDYSGLYTEAGDLRFAQAGLLVLAHPSQLPGLLRLWSKTNRAVQTIAAFAVGLASLWEPAL